MSPLDKLNRLTESHGQLRPGHGLITGSIALGLSNLSRSAYGGSSWYCATPDGSIAERLRSCGGVVLDIGLMALGVVGFALQFFIGPIGRALFPRGSDNGVEFFVVGMWFGMVTAIAPLASCCSNPVVY